MHTQNVNVKGAAEASRIWVESLHNFATQQLGYFCVKYTSRSVRGNFIAENQCMVYALNAYDAVFRFGRKVGENCKFVVTDVETLEAARSVCVSSKGYHFLLDEGVWCCLENSEFVEVTSEGEIWNAERQDPLPLYGKLA